MYPCVMAKFIIYLRAARSLFTPAELHSLSLATLNLSTEATSISETFPRKNLRIGFELTRYRLWVEDLFWAFDQIRNSSTKSLNGGISLQGLPIMISVFL